MIGNKKISGGQIDLDSTKFLRSDQSDSTTGSLTASSFIKSGATSNDVLLGDGTTTPLSTINSDKGEISLAVNDGGTNSTNLSFNSTYMIHISLDSDRTKFMSVIASSGESGGTTQGNLSVQADFSGTIYTLSILGNTLSISNDTLGAKSFTLYYIRTSQPLIEVPN